jgi:hypothetical protein
MKRSVLPYAYQLHHIAFGEIRRINMSQMEKPF